MKKFPCLSALVLTLSTALVASGFLALPSDAYGARMGGGRSFGSQPFMKNPASAPKPSYQSSAPQQRAMPQQARAPQQKGGLFSGFGGGMLGGFLAGSLLGSLFGNHSTPAPGQAPNGQPDAMAAQSSGPGMFDILLIGLLVWFVIRMFRRRTGAGQQGQQTAGNQPFGHQNNGYGAQPGYAGQGMERSSTGYGDQSGWDSLRGVTPGSQGGFGHEANIPADFNVEEFLRGAKAAYTRMQSSWDRRDLNDIANFATPAVMQELSRQMAEDPNPSQTQILLVNARLDAVEEIGNQERAQVYFDVLMREDPHQAQPDQVCELWTFVRPLNGNGNWKLDGLQQVQ